MAAPFARQRRTGGQPGESLPFVENAEARRLRFRARDRAHILDPSGARPFFERLEHRRDMGARPFDQRRYAAVGLVPDPARQAACLGLGLGPCTKADTLHAAGDVDDHRGGLVRHGATSSSGRMSLCGKESSPSRAWRHPRTRKTNERGTQGAAHLARRQKKAPRRSLGGGFVLRGRFYSTEVSSVPVGASSAKTVSGAASAAAASASARASSMTLLSRSVAMRRTRCVAPPVPAGIRRPTMTFSFRPTSLSRLPCTEASVSTRVVSWKDAAEMKDRVCNDALVMPRRIGSPCAGRPPLEIAFSFAASNSALSTCSPFRSVVSPLSRISHFWSIWRTITSMCLSLIFTPCSR